MSINMAKPHVLLIHGAWHRAWHLQFLQAELESAGYEVSSIDLPAGGEHAPTTGGLAADTEAIKNLIEEVASTSDSIMPVLHSYAGVPGSEAVAELSQETAKKIKHIVYLAAFAIPAGEGLSTPSGGHLIPEVKLSDDNIWATVPDPTWLFYHDVDPELAKEASGHLVRYSRSAFDQHTKHCGWKLFPKTYIFCTEDRPVPMALMQKVFAAMSDEDRAGWEFETIEGSHSPFLAKPKECAELIRKIAGEELSL